MKATPVIAVALGLVSVMVMFDAPAVIIVPGLKLFAAAGGSIAVSVAEAAVPVPALVVVTFPVLFAYIPVAIAVTGTTIVQLPDAGMAPPEIASELPPLVIVTVAPQVLVEGAAEVFFMLVEGYVSVNAAPVMAVVLGLVSVMVIVEAPFIRIEPGLKTFVTVGCNMAISVAEAAARVPASVVDICPVLFK